MGNIRLGIPQEIVLFLKEISRIDLFIETGTFQGLTTCWASDHFGSVKTIEFSKDIYINTKSKYSHLLNIEFIFGDSRKKLQKNSFHNVILDLIIITNTNGCIKQIKILPQKKQSLV